MSPEDFRLDIEALSPVLHVKEMRIVGGEPLLHPRLLEFLRLADASAMCGSIVIYTNGILLPDAPDELWGLSDQIIVSVYPNVKLRMSPQELKARGRRHGTAVGIRITPEFRLTLLNNEIKDPGLVRDIFSGCKLAHDWGCHAIHEGRYYKCPVPIGLDERLRKVGVALNTKALDGVPVRNNPNLKADLEAYIAGRSPLVACRYCLGSRGKMFAHHQLNNEGLTREIQEDHSKPEALIVESFRSTWHH